MRYVTVVVAMLVAAPVSSFAQNRNVDPPPPVLNDQQLLRKYVLSTLGTSGVLHATLESAFEQWRDSPEEWESDDAGYAKRWASAFAESAIGNTTKYAVASMLNHDPSFTRCQCSGFGPRLRHALAAPFMARTRTGRSVLSPATVAGLAAENIIPRSIWYPDPHGARDGFAHAASSVVSKMGVDVFREFVRFRRKPKP